MRSDMVYFPDCYLGLDTLDFGIAALSLWTEVEKHACVFTEGTSFGERIGKAWKKFPFTVAIAIVHMGW